MLMQLFYFLNGYVIISVKGDYCEKFINLALLKNIALFDIKRTEEGLEMKVRLKSFPQLRGLGTKTGCRVRVVSKKGAVFKMKRLKKRTALVSGIFLFAGIIYLLSSFVWQINIMGNERLTDKEITALLADSGIKIGTYTKSINIKESINKIRTQSSDIIWIGITVEGTRVNVEIAESVTKPDIEDKNNYCNILSDKEGIIEEIYVKSGKATTKKGDTVKVGDLLVSGVAESQTVGIRYFNAEADVKIRCWHEKSRNFEIKEKKRERTGNVKNRYRLTVGNFDINLFLNKPPFENYDFKTHHNKFFGIFDFQKIENFEMYEFTVKNKVEELIEIKRKEMYNNMLKDIGECEVINVYYDERINGNNLNMHITLETIEKCGVKNPI
mgnify:CR=1 FL=1